MRGGREGERWKGRKREKRHKDRERERRKERICYVTGFEDQRRGHGPRNSDGLQKLKEARKLILP